MESETQTFFNTDAEGRRRRKDRPEPDPETKHHLSNVPFTQWPMGASPSDRQVGEDDAGNPLFKMQFSEKTYIVKLDPDQRTQRQK